MSDSCCEKALDVGALEARQRRVLITVLLINAATFVMMMGGAFFSGSSALLSGALDNLGDALTYTLSIAVVGASVAAKARVALFKGVLIFGAACAVGGQIGWRLMHMDTPVFEAMGIAAVLNLVFNLVCLRMLTPYRHSDVNMASVWECSRNDVAEGFAVIAATLAVWLTDSGWPDLIIALILLGMFLRSATRVLTNAWRELYPIPAPG